MMQMDIESLSKVCTRCMQNLSGLSGGQLTTGQGMFNVALDLLERLEQAERWEKENFAQQQPVQTEDNNVARITLPTLPVPQPLNLACDNPKDIIFNAFLNEQPLRSLTPSSPERVSFLLRAVALAAHDSPLMPEEQKLLLHFIDNRKFSLLQNFIYQKMLNGYLDNPELYESLVDFILEHIEDLETAEEVIKLLPVITDSVWHFVTSHSEELPKMLGMLKYLILTCEQGSRGLEEIFQLVEDSAPEVKKQAISLISKHLYSLCREEIEVKVLKCFEEICIEAMSNADNESKIELYFKILCRNNELISHLIRLFPHIMNPITKTNVLKHFAINLRKKFPQNHPLLLEALQDSSNNYPGNKFVQEILPILTTLPDLHPDIKAFFLKKITEENQHDLIPVISLHFDLVIITQNDVEQILNILYALPREIRKTYLARILESLKIDSGQLLLMVLLHQGDEKISIDVISQLLEFTHVYNLEIVQSTIEKLVMVEPVPLLTMYFILKARGIYPLLKTYLIQYALPKLLEKKLWTYERIWPGFVTFLEKASPDSIELMEKLPEDVQKKLEAKETIRKAKIEYVLRKKNS